MLDNGNPEFDAGKNALHFNYTNDSIGAPAPAMDRQITMTARLNSLFFIMFPHPPFMLSSLFLKHFVMPGTSVEKVVRVKNIGENDAWVRVRVEKELTKALASSTASPLLAVWVACANTYTWAVLFWYSLPMDAANCTLLNNGSVTSPDFNALW